MSESIQSKRKFRISPDDHTVVQRRAHYGARWEDYRQAGSWTEASALVLALAMAKDETEELEAVKE